MGDFEFRVEGTNSEEVEQVTKTLIDKGSRKMLRKGITINLHNSTVGILNTGEIKDIKSISANISSLADSGHAEIAQGLKYLTEAVVINKEISSEEREYILDNLEELSKQALLIPEERAKPNIIKSILLSIATSLSAAGGLAEVWSTWGGVIRTYFGI